MGHALFMLLPLLPGTLPPDVCYETEQARLNGYMNVSSAVLDGGMAFYNFGSNKPSAANQIYPWLNTNDTQWYVYSGVWRRQRPLIEQYAGYRILYTGLESSIATLAGGDTNALGPTSGPFWEIDHNFDGRSPMGPGAIPTSNPGKTLAINEAFGEGAHAQTSTELFPHTHAPNPDQADGFLGHATASAPATFNVTAGGDTISMPVTGVTGGDVDGAPVAANVTHPVWGTWFLKPTSRLYIIVP